MDALTPQDLAERLTAQLGELEEANSRLTRELELKTAAYEALATERDEFRDAALMYTAMVAERNDERDQLKARIAALEARPVSSPPARRGPRSPAAIWGSSALEPEAAACPTCPGPSASGGHAFDCPTMLRAAGITPAAEAGIADETGGAS